MRLSEGKAPKKPRGPDNHHSITFKINYKYNDFNHLFFSFILNFQAIRLALLISKEKKGNITLHNTTQLIDLYNAYNLSLI